MITSGTGSRVFLEPEAAPYVTDKVLDVNRDTDGRYQFAVRNKV